MRRSQHLRTPANPCLPNAPPVADGEQSASSQPSPSRRKSCPAPAAAEPATTSPQLPRQCTIKPCDPIIANPTPRKAGSTSGGTRASAAAGLAHPPTRPNATLAFAIVQGQSRRWSNAQASGLVRHFYGHQCCAVATAAALVIDPGRRCHVLVMVWGCAWGRGKPLPSGAARGQSWATSSTTFCCSRVWHYSSRGLSSRPRAFSSDATLGLAKLLGQCAQVRENVAGD